MDKHYPEKTTIVIMASLRPGRGGRGFHGQSSLMGWRSGTFTTVRGWASVRTVEDTQECVDQLVGGAIGAVADLCVHQTVFGPTGLELILRDGH